MKIKIQREGVEVEVDPTDKGVEIEAELVDPPEIGEVIDPTLDPHQEEKDAAVAELMSKGLSESTSRLMVGLPPL